MREPPLDQDEWHLENGEAIHASYPDTFQIPDRRIREVLRPGDLAKLMFAIQFDPAEGETEPHLEFERMWVRVMERVGDRYLGRLANTPYSVRQTEDEYLVHGCEVPFGPEHVIDALPQRDVADDDPLDAMPPRPRRWA